jgi:phosphohistidine phosphatase
MDILLIRHGQAVEEAPGLGDAGRWLTEKGRRTSRKVGRWLAKKTKRRPAAIWTSGLVRAVQTAEIIAAEAGGAGEIQAVAELSPGRDPRDLVERLSRAETPGVLALVGHEPSLSLIAGALLGDVHVEGLKKGGVLALTWAEGVGQLRFVLDPAGMHVTKRLAPPAPDGSAPDEAPPDLPADAG